MQVVLFYSIRYKTERQCINKDRSTTHRFELFPSFDFGSILLHFEQKAFLSLKKNCSVNIIEHTTSKILFSSLTFKNLRFILEIIF